MYLFFVFTILAAVSSGLRVVDRFGGSRSHSGRCLVWIPDRNNQLVTAFPIDKMKSKFDWALNAFQRNNCSFKEGQFPSDMFFHYPNGSYSGPIGMIQRNEVTSMLYPVRPDSLPFSPGLIGPVIGPADVAIGYFKNDPIQIKREMTSFVTDFPRIVYAYIFIGLYLFAVCFMITEGREVAFTKRFRPKKLMSIFEKTAYTLLDQETLDAGTTRGRIILTVLHVLVIFFIYGLFLNKMGADLVIIRDPYSIDSIEELIHNDSTTKPIIAKYGFLLDLLKQAYVHRPDSTLGRMFEVIHSDLKNFTYHIDPNQNIDASLQKGLTLLKRMESKEVAYVIPHIGFQMMNRLFCLLVPDQMAKVKLAQETFAHGILTFLLSKDIDLILRKQIEYDLHTAMETSLITSVESGLLDALLMIYPTTIDTKILQCQDLHRDNAARIPFANDSYPWRKFYLHDYYSLFIVVALLLTAATVILVLEHVFNLVSEVMKERRRCNQLVKRMRRNEKKRMVQQQSEPAQICRKVEEQVALGYVRHHVVHFSDRRHSS